MLPECLAAITQAAGRPLTKAEADGIEERLLSSMQTLARKDPAGFHSLPRSEKLRQAGELARTRYTADLAAAQARTIRDMQTRVRELRAVDSFKPGLFGQLAALRQRLTMHGNYKGGDVSLDQKIKGVHRDFTRQLDGGAQKGHFWGLVQNPIEQHDIMRAIFGGETGKPEIDALGKQVRDVVEQSRVTANDAGIPIHHLDNYMPRVWAWEKIGANREQFVKRALEEIDPRDYVHRDGSQMSPAELHRFVSESAETLGTNGSNKRGEAVGGGFGSGVGASRNAPRQLKFRDPEAEIRMAHEFGSANNVMALLDQHFHALARDIATVRNYGRDADRFVSQLIDRAFAADAKSGLDENQLKQLDTIKRHTQKEYEALRSPGHPGALPLWAKVSDTIRGIVGSTLLGGSTISAIPDAAMAVAYGHELGITKRALLGNMAEGFKPTKENLAYIRRLGITAETMQNGTHRFGAGELSNQFTRFLNHGVHVASLLRMWDRMQIHGFSASLMDLLGEHVSKTDFAGLDAKDAAYMTSRGVTADHYNTWRQAEPEKGPQGNHTLLTPDAIYKIPDEKLRPIAEAKMSAISDAFKADAAKRNEANAKEAEWVAKRVDKFDALQQKAKDTLAQMEAKHVVREGSAQGVHDAKTEQLRRQVAQSEIELKLQRTLAVEHSQDRVRGILTDVAKAQAQAEAQFRSEPGEIDAKGNPVRRPTSAAGVYEAPSTDNASAAAVNKGMSIGEQIGRQRAIAEKRVRDSQKNVDALTKANTKAVDAKSKALYDTVSKRADELSQFVNDSRERTQKRTEMNDMFQKQHGLELDRTIRQLRSEAAQHLLALTLSESQIGGRGGTGNTIADNVRLHITADNAGTLMGQMARWLLFLKQTPLGIFRTHMLEVPGGMNDWKSAWTYRARFMVYSASLGMLALTLKNLALGQDPENLFTPKGAAKVAIASGGFGMYGDFLFGDKTEHENNGFVKVLGPGATALSDAYDMFTATQNEATGDGSTKPGQYGAKLLRFARNYAMPFTRLWYLKAAFNHMVYQQQMEKLSPGYNSRVRQRMARRGQSSWWAPGDMAPERAPDLGAAVGQKL